VGAQLKDKIQSAFLLEQLVDNHLRINCHIPVVHQKSQSIRRFCPDP